MSNSMNKSQLAEKLFQHFQQDERRNMSKAFASEIIDAIFGVSPRYTAADYRNKRCKKKETGKKVDSKDADGILASHLLGKPSKSKGKTTYNKVTIPGFGTLSVAYRKERKGRHPGTKKDIKIPETHVITFRPGKSLKTAAHYDIDK